jgi:hypothetical protein
VEKHRTAWRRKLVELDEKVKCCNRKCISEAIPQYQLLEAREQFMKYTDQTQRKKWLRDRL